MTPQTIFQQAVDESEATEYSRHITTKYYRNNTIHLLWAHRSMIKDEFRTILRYILCPGPDRDTRDPRPITHDTRS